MEVANAGSEQRIYEAPILGLPDRLEMMGALGNTDQFGFDWHRQQHYVGPVFSYAVSKNWIIHVEPAIGLSDVSDPFVLRMGWDIRPTTFYIGDRRLRKRRCRLGSAPAVWKRAVVVAVALFR